MAQNSIDSDRLSSAGLSTHSSGTAGTVGGSVVGLRVGDAGLKREVENEYNLGPLPAMWEKAFTPSGEVYFIDHNSGTSHWLDPRLARVRKHSLGECGEDELPYGWERVTDERYGSYYVDHINRRTQYENPVLQARRLRAEKLTNEASNKQPNGSASSGELRGDRFTVTLTKGTQGLGFTLIGADVEGLSETEGYLQIRSIVPHSPAWIDGVLRPGDVLVGVGSRVVRGLSHEQVAQIFQSITPGTAVGLHLVRGYPLAFDSEDPNTRVLSTLAVDASSPPDAVAMQQLTQALRTRFNLESPRHAAGSSARDETDNSPVTPQSPTQRRLLSRSFDLDELGTNNESEPVPPRCPSADHLLTLATDRGRSEAGREFSLTLRRGAAGFGFTIADSVHGQKVKKVLDRSRCSGLREGDLLLQIGDNDVRHAPHQHVVQVLKECPALVETSLRVWRRESGRAPRSRSATRAQYAPVNNSQLGRSKTPTAEQLRSPSLHTHEIVHNRMNGMNTEATYAIPEHKRESLIDRRRRSSTPGSRLTVPIVQPWSDPPPHTDPQPAHTWSDPQPTHTGSVPQPAHTWSDPQPPHTGSGPQPAHTWSDPQPTHTSSGPQPAHTWSEPQPSHAWSREPWLDNDVRTWAESAGTWENGAWDGGGEGNWGEVATPTVRVDVAGYWRGNASVADSSDNGGFPEDGMLHSPTTAAISGLATHSLGQSPARARMSPSNSGRLRSHSPSNNSSNDRLLTNSPSTRLQSQSPSNHSSSNGRIKGSPMRVREVSPPRGRIQSPSCFTCGDGTDSPGVATGAPHPYPGNYQQVEDPAADVVVRLARGVAGFGFRIVGGTEDGSRVAVGYVVPGGPAEGLLRAGDLLTSVDGVPLAGASHARAVAYVCQAAARGQVTLGVRHNRADITPLDMQPAHHQQMISPDQSVHHLPSSYNILHPSPMYPPAANSPMYGSHPAPYEPAMGPWGSAPYDVTVTRGEGEGFGFVVISSTNKATSTIGQLIANSPAARCGVLRVGDTILAINRAPIRNLPHPEVVALIKRSGRAVTLTVQPPERHAGD